MFVYNFRIINVCGFQKGRYITINRGYSQNKSITSSVNKMAGDSDEDEEIEETEEVHVEAPQVIETGDSVKVKQVLDDATCSTLVLACGIQPNYSIDNIKLLVMFVSCLFAVTAQFYPMPFPQSRPLLGICCFSYALLSGILQYIVTFVDKVLRYRNTIMIKMLI
jgi:hypothetical protein